MVSAEVSVASAAYHKQHGTDRPSVWTAPENKLDTTSSPPVLVHRGQRYPLPPGLEPQLYQDIRASPFLDLDSPMTAYEWTKFVLTTPFLLIRICLVATIVPVVLLVTHLFVAGQAYNEPLPQWKARILQPFLRFWAEILLLVGLNFWHQVKGKEHIAEAEQARALLVINHVSYLDALVMGQVFMPCGLAKSAVTNIPCVGILACALQFLLVERRGTEDAHVLNSQKGSVTNLLHERARDPRFPLFMIGPEGTTKAPDVLLPFSTGAFVHGEPVLPVLLKYRSRHFNVGWGSIQSPAWHFLRVQAQFVNHLAVEILPVYRPSTAEAGDPKLYADNVRQLMAARGGLQLCEEGLEAHMRLKRAGIMVDWTGRHIIQRLPKPRRHHHQGPTKKDR